MLVRSMAAQPSSGGKAKRSASSAGHHAVCSFGDPLFSLSTMLSRKVRHSSGSSVRWSSSVVDKIEVHNRGHTRTHTIGMYHVHIIEGRHTPRSESSPVICHDLHYSTSLHQREPIVPRFLAARYYWTGVREGRRETGMLQQYFITGYWKGVASQQRQRYRCALWAVLFTIYLFFLLSVKLTRERDD